MHVYGTKDLVGLLGISRAKIRSLTRSGHLSPRKGERGELQFSFQDLIVLRTAKALRAASIPTRRINSSLKQLKQSLPPTVPLTGLSITSVGGRLCFNCLRELLIRRVGIDAARKALAVRNTMRSWKENCSSPRSPLRGLKWPLRVSDRIFAREMPSSPTRSFVP